MEQAVYPVVTGELVQRRKELAPATHDAFQAFSRQVFAAGALDEKTKQLIPSRSRTSPSARTASEGIPKPPCARAPVRPS